MSDKYILTPAGNPKQVDDLMEWARWFETADRIVHQQQVGDYFVSTVFLGLDHSFGSGPPLLFETMVFDEQRNEMYCERYSTWEQAVAGHDFACTLVMEGKFEEEKVTLPSLPEGGQEPPW